MKSAILGKTYEKACFSQSTDEVVDVLIDTYDVNVKDNVDKHAPKQVKVTTLCSYASWCNDQIKEERREIKINKK